MPEFSNLDERTPGEYETGARRGGRIEWLWHPHVHGGEVSATLCHELMAPHSPEEYRQETCWYYAQSGPGVFKGDLWFYSVDHDFRNRCEQIPGTVPIYFMTGVYDWACTPEKTQSTASRVKNSECIIMEEIGHFPMCENPMTFKKYLMSVLGKVLKAR